MGDPDELRNTEHDGDEDEVDTGAWLDELVGGRDQGADDTIESAAGAAETTAFGGGAEMPDWLKAELETGTGADDTMPEWLREELAVQEAGDLPPAASVDAEATMILRPADDEGAGSASAGETVAEAEQPLDEAESEDDLSWLEQIATGSAPALEEPLTMSWDEDTEPAEAPDEPAAELEEPSFEQEMSWLADLAGDDADGDQSTVEEPVLPLEEEIELALLEDDLGGAFDVPEDPDEAMAWLERLAAQQGAAAEELTVFSAEDDLPAVSEEPVAEASLADELADLELPQDDAEALAWLAELAGVPEEGAEAEPAEETSAFAVAELEEEIVLEEVAEPLVEEEFVIRDEWEAEVAVAELAADEEDDETAGWLEEVEPLTSEAAYEQPQVEASEEPGEEAEPEAADDRPMAELDELLGETELEDALPDWLPMEEGVVTDAGEADWPPSAESWDAARWLASEEEVSQEWAPAEVEHIHAELGISRDEFEEEDELGSSAGDDLAELDQERLAAARAALSDGDVAGAAMAYGALLERGEGLPFLIAELENAVAGRWEQPQLHRLLGDAYVQNGQLQKALSAYRVALDHL